MPYAKSQLTEEILDNLRIRLSGISNKIRPEPSCDFCGAPNPSYVYHATQTIDGETASIGQIINRWCACVECSALIDVHDWNSVEDRLVDILVNRLPDFDINAIKGGVQHSLEEFHKYSIYQEYIPTSEDTKWARMLMAAIADEGIWGFISAKLTYKIDHKNKKMVLQNPEQLSNSYSKEAHTRTRNVWKTIGYTVE